MGSDVGSVNVTSATFPSARTTIMMRSSASASERGDVACLSSPQAPGLRPYTSSWAHVDVMGHARASVEVLCGAGAGGDADTGEADEMSMLSDGSSPGSRSSAGGDGRPSLTARR